jgi:hypothetical protein
MTQTTMSQYLSNPAAFMTSIPPAPPSKGLTSSPSSGPRGQKGGKLGAGAIAGIVIGVLAAVGIVGALAFFVIRPIIQVCMNV